MDPLLSRLARSVTAASDLEALTRPLLELIETVTGMESSYLTSVDEIHGLQQVVFARNAGDLDIPEGLSVEWGDTLCRRALEENRPFTNDVPVCWSDSVAARELGIQSYMSHPVHLLDGSLYGTLCAASRQRIEPTADMLKVIALFAGLIAQQVEREQLVAQLQKSNAELSSHALVDPLTGIANRRALMQELERQLARAQRTQQPLQIAFMDLDGFKAINDRHGHDAGDWLLGIVATRLSGGLRKGDFVARYGGDEFVVIAGADGEDDILMRLQDLTTGTFDFGGIAIDCRASIGVVAAREGDDAEALLSRADAAMYEAKRAAGRQRR